MPVDEARLDRPIHILREIGGLIADGARIVADLKALADGATEAEIDKLEADVSAFVLRVKAERLYAKSHRSEARQAQAERAAAKRAADADEAEAEPAPDAEPAPKKSRKRA